ncbi:hypothetical protein C4E24_01065 [ANME-1 cluster archaeon AG-394-G21]|nr:hypothetical protein [ANME-1 cluster archaeon AG-394-G21]
MFLANLDPVVGSEQGKTRPVLVISEEEINQLLWMLYVSNWGLLGRICTNRILCILLGTPIISFPLHPLKSHVQA